MIVKDYDIARDLLVLFPDQFVLTILRQKPIVQGPKYLQPLYNLLNLQRFGPIVQSC